MPGWEEWETDPGGKGGTLAAGGSGQWREMERTANGRGFWGETFPCLPQTCGGWWCEERFVPPHITSSGLRLSSGVLAGEILNSRGRVRGRNSLNLAQPLCHLSHVLKPCSVSQGLPKDTLLPPKIAGPTCCSPKALRQPFLPQHSHPDVLQCACLCAPCPPNPPA